MNKAVVPSVVIAAIAVVALLWSSAPPGDPRRGADEEAVGDIRPAGPHDVALGDASSSGSAVEEIPEPDRVLAPPSAEQPDDEARYTMSRVFGRVVDVRGQPLVAASARLRCVSGRWVSEDLHPEEVSRRYETKTDAGGGFAFEVVTPTAEWISLTVSSGAYHALAGRDFGLAGGRNQDPIRAGENDVGTFVLSDTGAISGRVLDVRRNPIPNAVVRLDGQYPGGRSISEWTGTDGRFVLGQLPPGTWSFLTRCDGYLSLTVSQVAVSVGQTTPDVDFVLADAPFLSGYIFDEQGSPLSGVRLWGWPRGGGRGAGGRSDEQGAFRVYLPQAEPYSMGAKLPGYEEIPDRGVAYEPGTADIRLVMKKPRMHTFMVLDQATQEPIERFGMKLIQVRTERGATSSSEHREPAPVTDHADGRVELAGDPKYFDYVIDAPGYGAKRGKVEVDEQGRQTILLAPEGRIVGRLVLNGAPVRRPTARLEVWRIPVEEDPNDMQTWVGWKTDLDEYAGRMRIVSGEEDGRFSIGGLAAGTYQLTLSGKGAAPITLEGLQLESGAQLDLGDIEGPLPGAVFGVVRLAGRSPGGVSLTIDRDDERKLTVDETGAFRFEGLGPGPHELQVEPMQGVVADGAPFAFDLTTGEEKEMSLDLTERMPVRVRVRVLISGSLGVGVQVGAKTLNERGATKHQAIGKTDATGVVEGWLPPSRRIEVFASNEFGVTLARAGEPFERRGGASLEVELNADPGRLRIRMPAGAAPQQGAARERMEIDLGEDWRMGIGLLPEWTSVEGRLIFDVGDVAPGPYKIDYFVAGVGWLTASVKVEAGTTATAELQPVE